MTQKMKTNSISPITIVFFFFFFSISSITIAMADVNSNPTSVHIVYTERPVNEEPESLHIRTLIAVLGSEEAAREALVYSYKNAASGFSAKLTLEQVAEISKQPGVLHVVQSQTLQLHSGGVGLHSGGVGLH